MRHDNRLMGMISLFASHAELPLPDYKSVFRGLVNTGMLSEYHPCKAKCNLRHKKFVGLLKPLILISYFGYLSSLPMKWQKDFWPKN